MMPAKHLAACSEESIRDVSLSRDGQWGPARCVDGCLKDQATPCASKLTTVSLRVTFSSCESAWIPCGTQFLSWAPGKPAPFELCKEDEQKFHLIPEALPAIQHRSWARLP